MKYIGKILFIMVGGSLLIGCGSTAQKMGVSQKKWSSYTRAKQSELAAEYKYAHKGRTKMTLYKGPKLRVYLADGTVKMPPFTGAYHFQTRYFNIAPGQCKKIRLNSSDLKHHVNMNACYNGLALSLDPSMFNIMMRQGTVHFDYNPIWKRSFTYSDVSSSGYVGLQHASVTIKALPKVAPVYDVNSPRYRYGY